MFGLRKKKSKTVTSTQTGMAVALSEVPDDVFAQKMLGDGIAVLPESGTVLAPASGEIVDMPDSLHAYCIHTAEGPDLLVHVGINTVELKGEGFQSFVKKGDRVEAGQKLAEVDLGLLKKKGYALYTSIIITNMDTVSSCKTFLGKAVAGETVVLEYTLK